MSDEDNVKGSWVERNRSRYNVYQRNYQKHKWHTDAEYRQRREDSMRKYLSNPDKVMLRHAARRRWHKIHADGINSVNRERYRTDPEFRKRKLDAGARYRQNRALDPEYRETIKKKRAEKYHTDAEHRAKVIQRAKENRNLRRLKMGDDAYREHEKQLRRAQRARKENKL